MSKPKCEHNRGCWSWRTKAGLTVKCRCCGMIQHHKWKSPSGYREFIPGVTTLHPDGRTSFELVEITSCVGEWVEADDWRYFRR